MKHLILSSLKLTLLFVILFCLLYPLLIIGIAKILNNKGEGITFSQNGQTIGYRNIAQRFTQDKYFWSRPSAVNYNGAGSGGSNKGPGNPEYLKEIQARVDTFLIRNPGIKRQDIPADIVTASGSGLDPDISIAAAMIQVPRVAKARNISKAALNKLIENVKEGPLWGVFGPCKVNVLQLNLELDKIR